MNRGFYKPFIISSLLTVPGVLLCVLFGMVSWGGAIIPAAVLFPYAILLGYAGEVLLSPAGLFISGLALIFQFPLYGYLLGRANMVGLFRKRLRALAICHLICSTLLILIGLIWFWNLVGVI